MIFVFIIQNLQDILNSHFLNSSTGFHVSTEVSLGFVATSLSAGVLLSLMKKSD